jgi:hypothetical protein
MKRSILILGIFLPLAGAARALAHYAFTAEYDGTQKMQIEGVVTEFAWRSPHSFMKMSRTKTE